MSGIRVPGDKSITHRALIFGALGSGLARIREPLVSQDTLTTARVLGQLGVSISELDPDGGETSVIGVGLRGLRPPSGSLDCGNSGTTARLLLGVLAGQPIAATLTGDESLRSRPMKRVTEPLERMGARVEWLEEEGFLPLTIRGGRLTGLEFESPVASAQVKSALLLAGLVGGVAVRVREPGRSRDHTERFLEALGVSLVTQGVDEAWEVELRDPPDRLPPPDLSIPADFSSAAFLIGLGLLRGPSEGVRIHRVGLNPTRTALLPVLRSMGARIEVERVTEEDRGEPVGDVTAFPSELSAIDVPEDGVPGFIDEIPLLAALATRARGVTRIRGAAELRVKESDRIRAMVDNLRAVGVRVVEHPDGLDVEGTTRPPRGPVEVRHDHRIAMAFGVLGTVPGARVDIDDPSVVDVSFPGFWAVVDEVGAHSGAAPVVTVDGPAGAGKSTTAREVAATLGFRHLDSGALYRALTAALLETGVAPEEWGGLEEGTLDAFGVRLEPVAGGFRILAGDTPMPEVRLRSPEVTERVSQVARLPTVRSWLLRRQREVAGGGGLVADGRDMGTVVFPGAEVKIFLVADLRERARRRLLERGLEADERAVAAECEKIAERDRADRERSEAPLVPAPDAVELDTTHLSFREQVDAIVDRVVPLLPAGWIRPHGPRSEEPGPIPGGVDP